MGSQHCKQSWDPTQMVPDMPGRESRYGPEVPADTKLGTKQYQSVPHVTENNAAQIVDPPFA